MTADTPQPLSAEEEAEVRERHARCYEDARDSLLDCIAPRLFATLDAERAAQPSRQALGILDVIDGIVDDTHPEGDGCPLCTALDDLRAALAAEPVPSLDVDTSLTLAHIVADKLVYIAAKAREGEVDWIAGMLRAEYAR